jgi:trans-aconitate methyltransferase
MSNLDSFASAYQPDFMFHDENIAMLTELASNVVAKIREQRSSHVISLGIGHAVVSKAISSQVFAQEGRYSIVEGSEEIIARFRQAWPAGRPQPAIHRSLFEDFVPEAPCDIVEMGFVLEHVDDPERLLRHCRTWIGPAGAILLAVPNALSLHRRIGMNAGLLDDPYRLSEADLQLGHQHYFDLPSLQHLVRKSGLQPRRVEGIMLKPLTTAQLRRAGLPPEVQAALARMGRDFPEIANALYIEAVLG